MIGVQVQSAGVKFVKELKLMGIFLRLLQSEKFSLKIENPTCTNWSDTVDVG